MLNIMTLSALSTSGINGRFGTSQDEKMNPISDASSISFSDNSSRESPPTHPDTSESSEDIASDENRLLVYCTAFSWQSGILVC